MARTNRSEVFSPDESAIVHVISRVVRRCFLLGDELRDKLGSRPSSSGYRCSDNGFLNMSSEDYLALLGWTARQAVAGKRGVTPVDTPPILGRLGLEADVWCELVQDFGSLFSLVAGRPVAIDEARTRGRQARFHTRPRTRELLSN